MPTGFHSSPPVESITPDERLWIDFGEVERAIPISGPLFRRRNDFVCNTNIRRCGMKSFERCFGRSAFEACFEGVELQGKGRHRKPKIHQFFYARISIHGLQGSRQNGEFGQLCTSVRQYRDRTNRALTRRRRCGLILEPLAVPTTMRSRNPRAQCVSERKSRDEYGYHCRESDGVHTGPQHAV